MEIAKLQMAPLLRETNSSILPINAAADIATALGGYRERDCTASP